MTEKPTREIYSKSPITEAVIDIRTVSEEAISVRDLNKAGSCPRLPPFYRPGW